MKILSPLDFCPWPRAIYVYKNMKTVVCGTLWIGELTRNSLGFLKLWLEPGSGHMWESQGLHMDGKVVFALVLRFFAHL